MKEETEVCEMKTGQFMKNWEIALFGEQIICSFDKLQQMVFQITELN